MRNALTTERHDQVLGTGLNVLIFLMDSSPACGQFRPELDEFVRRRPEVAVWTVDAMGQRELATRHDLKALPSIVVYRDGLPCRRFAGVMPAGQLSEAVDEVAAADMGEELQEWMLWMAETGEAGSPYIEGPAGEARPDSAVELPEASPFADLRSATRSLGSPLTAARPLTEAGAMMTGEPLMTAAMSPLIPTVPAMPMVAAVPAMPAMSTEPGRTAEFTSGPDRESLMNSAMTAWYAGDAATAIRDFSSLLEMDPASDHLLNSRGQVLADNGGGATAVKDLDAAIAGTLDEFSVAYARSARALALAQVGRHDEADHDMAEALAVTPNSAWAHFRKARILLLRGDVAGMDSELRRAMETAEPPLTQHQRAMAEALLRLSV
ncbi:tetratricopeptide repeat protein [Kineosporia succinea]|uniref:Thioredoxin-like negative regulator of GroEL n=1 Tax=Kineosporia succinea TaxID=84632 RepID=A0ABT9NX11_9ACTN|nr:tetratricopeptide repeat protein [Kineosporia succinea]MDP9824966.1 thioredoxin-like negative regulator of GroEL [Kineosporia succinea]